MRYAVAGVNFVLMGTMTALLVGFLVHLLFPHPVPDPQSAATGGDGFAAFLLDWRTLPGALLGLLAGLRSARASLRNSR